MELINFIKQTSKKYSKDDLAQITSAIDYATKAHKGQMRDSGKPYISHPLAVAKILVEWGMDLNSVIAGVLHDTVEDTKANLEEITELFGKDVSRLVDGLTKVSKARSGMKDLSKYTTQTTDNLSKLLIASSQDIRVIIIKLADRYHNLTELQYKKPASKQIKIARESLAVFAPIADRIGMGRVRMQIEEISFRYLDSKRYYKLSKLMRKKLGKSSRKLGQVKIEVQRALHKAGIKFEINGRVKSIYSLHKKMLKKNDNIDDIYDLIALRIIVKTPDDCYRALGILHSMYRPMIARIKDYIAVPKANGYQSLHTTVITPNKYIAEFQIRTEEMHQYAEEGLAAAFHYHQQKSSKNYLKKGAVSQVPTNLKWISQLQDIAKKLADKENLTENQLSVDLFKDRIFVYSPKGDIYNLPEGALPLDFAYLVHSKIGKHASAFMVNHNIQPFDKPLQNGDLIEVITKSSVLPKKAWLKLVITSHAKTKLKNQLKKQDLD